jgi:hypothetical protein
MNSSVEICQSVTVFIAISAFVLTPVSRPFPVISSSLYKVGFVTGALMVGILCLVSFREEGI